MEKNQTDILACDVGLNDVSEGKCSRGFLYKLESVEGIIIKFGLLRCIFVQLHGSG